MRSLGGSMTRGRQLGNRKPGDSWPAIQYLDPISSVNTLWSTNDYQSIDNGVRQPTIAGVSGTCVADKNDDNEEQIFGMALGSSGTYSTLRLWAIGTNDFGSSTPILQARLNINGSWTAKQPFATQFNAVLTGSWRSLDFSGPFTLPLTTLQVGLETGTMDDGEFDQISINEIYIEAIP